MPERISPLSQWEAVAGLAHRSLAALVQYHAWPEHYAQMAQGLAAHCGLSEAPRPGRAACGATASLLRVHPQRLWLVAEHGLAGNYPQVNSDVGAVLDLTHARTVIRIDQDIAVPLLSRFIAIDLRPDRFAVDDIALTPLHRVSVVLWRRPSGIDILAPRSFARSIWDLLAEAAQQLR
jgi:heterotetrameric sarcosine oxidase gamma subunit